MTNGVYIWKYISGLTTRYHNGGGALVVASSETEAKRKLVSYITESNDEMMIGEVHRTVDSIPNANHMVPTTSSSGLVIIFPDAGCC